MKEIPKESRFFKSFDGSNIFYERRGDPDGVPIIFLYGIACSANHWRHQIRYFSEHFQTVTMDYRGHQRTEIQMAPSKLDIEVLAKDAIALMDHLGFEKAVFCGHSFGGSVILKAYELAPNLFERMILANAFSQSPFEGKKWAINTFEFLRFGQTALPAPYAQVWKFLVNNPILEQATALAGGFNIHLTSYRDIEVYSRSVGTVSHDAFHNLFESLLNFDGRKILPNIEAPTLVIAGSKDTVTPQEFQKEIADNVMNGEYFLVPYGSHCTPLDMPEYVNLKMENFLRQ